jgi:mannose-6-phosphate isomerase-like protein (cupin superfamily)
MTEPTDRASTVDLGRYAIHYQPLFQTLEKMDVQLIDTVEEPWYNQTLIQVGDVLVRLGVMQGGEFHWHKHDEQDEFFYLLQGEFHIELQDHDTVVLSPHQAFSVPAGMLHRPLVPVRSAVIMIEKAGIVATGD